MTNPNAVTSPAASRDRELFQSLTDAKTPAGALGASVGVHAVLVLALIVLPLLAPQALHMSYRTMFVAPPPPPEPHRIEVVRLIPPPPPPKPIAQPTESAVEKFTAPAPRLPARDVRLPEIVTKPMPPPMPSISSVEPKAIPTVAAPPPPPVVTNVFSSAPTPAANTAAPRTTEAAGFGVVNPSDRPRSANSEIVPAGFGRTSGPEGAGRSGNIGDVAAAGFGGASGGQGSRGRSGNVQSVGRVGGFDAGAPGGVPGGSGNRGPVLTAGFSTPAAPKAGAANSQKAVDPDKIDKPVEITLKPRPDYSDEARKMRIEGEVLLRVQFTSLGQARVLEVISGLGHGLNENAIRAAEKIQFKPAQRGGQPVDSTATVHIVFQLAY